MTKQDYIVIAKALYDSNARFDKDRFVAACKQGLIQARRGVVQRKAW